MKTEIKEKNMHLLPHHQTTYLQTNLLYMYLDFHSVRIAPICQNVKTNVLENFDINYLTYFVKKASAS